jgi:hypothetical protein
MPGGDLNGVTPPGGGAGGSTGQPLEPMDPLPDAAPSTSAPPPTGPTEDVPLRLVGIPVNSAKTSFFTGFEVFLAERRIGPGKTELIKLVYEFLPYQKRLSEYDLSTTKIYKLRAIPDPRCNESLMQMMWPEGDPAPDGDPQSEAHALAARVADKNAKLRCYRTTADDFSRAIGEKR